MANKMPQQKQLHLLYHKWEKGARMDNMNNGLTAGDIMALTKDNDGVFGGGVGFIILLFIFIWAVFGGNMFGGASNSSLSTAELYSSLGSQDLKNDVRSGFTSVLAGQNNLNTQILDNKFTAQLGFQNLGSQMASCCCDIKNTIITENQATRDLIQSNYISGLQTALSDAKDEISNLNQTNALLTTMGRWYSYAPYSCNGCNTYTQI